jgi:hypothetical protein
VAEAADIWVAPVERARPIRLVHRLRSASLPMLSLYTILERDIDIGFHPALANIDIVEVTVRKFGSASSPWCARHDTSSLLAAQGRHALPGS